MGLECSPDISQAIMENVLSDIKHANVYINGVGAFSNDQNHHDNLLATILHQLCKHGFTINPLKCEWAVKETDWLDYWLTPRGLKPWKNKIDAILHVDCPCNATELCMFIGCVNYYGDMWPSHAHILNSLTAKSILAGEKPVATYSISMQEQYIIFYVKQKLGVPKSTYQHNAQIGEY